jgi:hypothetical protein
MEIGAAFLLLPDLMAKGTFYKLRQREVTLDRVMYLYRCELAVIF